MRRLLPLLALAAACAPAPDSAADTAAAPPAAPEKVAEASGFSTPESVRWDEPTGHWFVSNINGAPGAKDDNGFIVRLTADGALVDSAAPFIAGGERGVTLHAPKGMAITGDTLWVADIDVVRAFDKRTGAPLAAVAVAGAKFLNDVAAAVTGDGAVYVTDTGVEIGADGVTQTGPFRVVRIQGGAATVAVTLPDGATPNGIAWDAANNRFLINGFGSTTLFAWAPGDSAAREVGTWVGGGDGLEVLPDGRVLLTSWTDSSVTVWDGAAFTKLVGALEAPADIGVNVTAMRLAVPRFNANTVELWTIPPRR
jgi:sugar lactone lactonase YvrE